MMRTLMWVVIVLGSALVFGYATLWILARIPWRHRVLTPPRLESLLTALLQRGAAGSQLMIDVRNDAFFLQFKVYEVEGRKGIRSDFPHASWSASLLPRLLHVLERHRIPHKRDEGGGNPVMKFTVVDFHSDVHLAQRYATAVMQEVFEVAPEKDVVARLINVQD